MTKESIKNYRNTVKQILFDRPLAYHPDMARAFGGVRNAVMLGQIFYWSHNPDAIKNKGWCFQLEDKFYEETGLTKNEQRTARRELQEQNLLECERRGIPPKIWYRINWDVLIPKLTAFYESGQRYYSKRQRTGRTDLQRGKRGRWQKTVPIVDVLSTPDPSISEASFPTPPVQMDTLFDVLSTPLNNRQNTSIAA